jgi:hypothetical protein
MSDIKTMVRGAYDIQKLRIQMGNRIVANWKAKLGQAPSATEETLDAAEKTLLDDLRESYKKLADGVATLPRQSTFKGDELISTYTELVLIDQYLSLEEQENKQFSRLKNVLKDFPVYNEFLVNVYGVGPAMAGVIVSEINIHAAQYPSSLWKYAGLDVAGDGQGRSRRKEHLVESTYLDKEKKEQTKMGISFNPFLKTKLVGVLGSSFIKQSAVKCPYRKIYDDYKHRLENSPAHVEKSKGHRHSMAVRYAVKRFLADLYVAWRTLEGLPVANEYSVDKLGIVHRIAA